MTTSCAVLCGMPCSIATAEQMFRAVSEHSYAIEWITGNVNVPVEQLVDAYMRDLPVVWHDVVAQLSSLDVRTVADATSDDLAGAFSQCDVTILVAHHVQADDLASIGIELADGVLEIAEIPAISPMSRKAVVDLLGVCRSVPFIPLVKARCSSARVIARETRMDPVAQLRLIPQVLRAWRANGGDYVQTITNLRFEMLRALGVGR
jgi:hypothetical protein